MPQDTIRRALKRLAKEAGVVIFATILVLGISQFVLRLTQSAPAVSDPAGTKQASLEMSSLPAMIAGKHITILGKELVGGYSLLVITSPSCPFCVRSIPFHRRLIREARQRGVPVWLAVPTSPDTGHFLAHSRFGDADVVNWHDIDRRFQGTPSILLIGPGSVIKRMWIGELKEDGEASVLASLQDPTHVTTPARRLEDGELVLSPSEIHSLPLGDRAVVVSISERWEFRRDHPSGAINIPLKELSQRADRDLQKDRLNIIDCSALDDAACLQTLSHLRKVGFRVSGADFGGGA